MVHIEIWQWWSLHMHIHIIFSAFRNLFIYIHVLCDVCFNWSKKMQARNELQNKYLMKTPTTIKRVQTSQPPLNTSTVILIIIFTLLHNITKDTAQNENFFTIVEYRSFCHVLDGVGVLTWR